MIRIVPVSVAVLSGCAPREYLVGQMSRMLDAGMIVHTIDGAISLDEALSAFDRATADERFRPSMNVLWDFTNGTILGGATDEIQELSKAFSRRLEHSAFHKAAVAAPQDLAYGIARMYEGFSGEQPVDLNVFRSREEAMSWLRAELAQP